MKSSMKFKSLTFWLLLFSGCDIYLNAAVESDHVNTYAPAGEEQENAQRAQDAARAIILKHVQEQNEGKKEGNQSGSAEDPNSQNTAASRVEQTQDMLKQAASNLGEGDGKLEGETKTHLEQGFVKRENQNADSNWKDGFNKDSDTEKRKLGNLFTKEYYVESSDDGKSHKVFDKNGKHLKTIFRDENSFITSKDDVFKNARTEITFHADGTQSHVVYDDQNRPINETHLSQSTEGAATTTVTKDRSYKYSPDGKTTTVTEHLGENGKPVLMTDDSAKSSTVRETTFKKSMFGKPKLERIVETKSATEKATNGEMSAKVENHFYSRGRLIESHLTNEDGKKIESQTFKYEGKSTATHEFTVTEKDGKAKTYKVNRNDTYKSIDYKKTGSDNLKSGSTSITEYGENGKKTGKVTHVLHGENKIITISKEKNAEGKTVTTHVEDGSDGRKIHTRHDNGIFKADVIQKHSGSAIALKVDHKPKETEDHVTLKTQLEGIGEIGENISGDGSDVSKQVADQHGDRVVNENEGLAKGSGEGITENETDDEFDARVAMEKATNDSIHLKDLRIKQATATSTITGAVSEHKAAVELMTRIVKGTEISHLTNEIKDDAKEKSLKGEAKKAFKATRSAEKAIIAELAKDGKTANVYENAKGERSIHIVDKTDKIVSVAVIGENGKVTKMDVDESGKANTISTYYSYEDIGKNKIMQHDVGHSTIFKTETHTLTLDHKNPSDSKYIPNSA